MKKFTKIEQDLKEIYTEREKAELRAKWSKTLKKDYEISKKKTISYNRIWYSIAALVLIGFCTFSYSYYLEKNNFPNPDALIAEFEVISNPNFGQRAAGINESKSLVNDAYNNMLDGNFDKAISIYVAADNELGLDDFGNFHLALCFLKMDQAENSIPILTNLIQKGQYYKAESNWLLSLAYLKTNQKLEAKKVLSKIIESKSYKYKQAKILLANN